jgi:hypothetical protein
MQISADWLIGEASDFYSHEQTILSKASSVEVTHRSSVTITKLLVTEEALRGDRTCVPMYSKE